MEGVRRQAAAKAEEEEEDQGGRVEDVLGGGDGPGADAAGVAEGLRGEGGRGGGGVGGFLGEGRGRGLGRGAGRGRVRRAPTRGGGDARRLSGEAPGPQLRRRHQAGAVPAVSPDGRPDDGPFGSLQFASPRRRPPPRRPRLRPRRQHAHLRPRRRRRPPDQGQHRPGRQETPHPRLLPEPRLRTATRRTPPALSRKRRKRRRQQERRRRRPQWW
mmetsp:Transcript_12585/g.41242  ORF Transcript_12585/g.41242 Transcript_12585/m.41242 type:complete len:215 (-) Transcript_12585:309-953(-)